jgi:hypothetical protein
MVGKRKGAVPTNTHFFRILSSASRRTISAETMAELQARRFIYGNRGLPIQFHHCRGNDHPPNQPPIQESH